MAYLQLTAIGRSGEPEYRIVFYFSIAGILGGALSFLWTGMHAHTLSGALLLLAVGLLATAAQLLMTRAYGSGSTLVNASLQYLGIAYLFRLRRAAVRRPGDLDGAARHGADRQRRAGRDAAAQPQHPARHRKDADRNMTPLH